jgi:hypothetical protein
VLTLEVRYRYLSFDKRGESGDGGAKKIIDEYLKRNNNPKKP